MRLCRASRAGWRPEFRASTPPGSYLQESVSKFLQGRGGRGLSIFKVLDWFAKSTSDDEKEGREIRNLFAVAET
jgi:hypothetical protein